MALRRLPYLPGVVKDDTSLAAQGYAIDSDKIRFVRGRPESQEGYVTKIAETVSGYTRGGWTWTDENGKPYLAAGTSSGLYTMVSNRLWDITPERDTSQFTTSTFASVTSGSDQVVLSMPNHDTKTGDYIYIWSASSVGGVEFGGYTSGFTNIGVTANTYAATMTISGHGLSNYDMVMIDSSTSLSLGGVVLNGTSGSIDSAGVYTVSGMDTVQIVATNHGLWGGDLVTISGLSAVGGLTVSGTYYVQYVEDANNFYVQASGVATSTASGGGASGTFEGTRVYRVRVQNADQVLFYVDTLPTATTSGGSGVSLTTARRYQVTTSGADELVITGSGTATSTTSGGGVNAFYQLGLAGGRTNSTGTGYGTGPYGTGTYGTYTGAIDLKELEARVWIMDNYGTFLVCNPRGGRAYVWELNPSRRALWLTRAPEKNNAIAVTQERVLVSVGCTNNEGQYDPMLVRYSTAGGFINVWIPNFDNSAGDDRLGEGSELIAVRNTETGYLVWSDTAVFFGRYTGNPDQLYQHNVIGTNCGLMSPLAYVEQDGSSFWVSDKNQFYVYAGGAPRALSCPNRDWFETNLDSGQRIKTFAALDIKYGGVVWYFPTTNTTNPGEVDTYLRLDTREMAQTPIAGWSVGTYARTYWLSGTVYDNPIAFGWDGTIYDQSTGNSADGAAITRYIRYAPLTEANPEIGDGTFLLNWTRLVLDSVTGSNTTLQAYFYLRDWPNGTERTKGPYTWTSSTEKIDVRLSGREIELEVRSVGTDDDWRLGSVRGDLTMGRRR